MRTWRVRTFTIVLGCIAWVLSCFVAVSYFEADHQQQVLGKHLQSATAAAASVEAVAGRDGDRLKQRVERDQEAVTRDQLSLQKTGKLGAADAQGRQVLTADQAALQADRMMQYTLENFARSEPDPEVTGAIRKVDLNERQLADAVSTKERDRTLAHFLIALWAIAGGTAFLAFRGVRPGELAAKTGHDDELEVESDLAGDEGAE